MTTELTKAAQLDMSTPTLREMVTRHALEIDPQATLEDMPEALAFQIDMARALMREISAPQQATPAQYAGELHLFEFWWEAHMPQATQAQAWKAWTAAQDSKGAAIEAPQQATPATPEDMKVYDGIAAGYFADTQQATPDDSFMVISYRTNDISLEPTKDFQRINCTVNGIDGTAEARQVDENTVDIGRVVAFADEQATPEPVPADQAKWCEYVAGMVDCWVSAEWSNYHHKDEDRRVKAIAGIIERRLWALQKQQPATPEPECARSHPHENMSATCELRTEIARLRNENTRLKAATPEPVGEQATVPRDAYDALERERDYWRTRARAMIDHAEGTCWYWMGDGSDHPESMVNSLPVVIRAEQLRELLASPAQGVPDGLEEQIMEALRDGLSVCMSVSVSRDRKISRDGCTLYAQTEEWCRWLDAEVGPKIRAAVDALAAAQAKGGQA